MAKFSGTTDLLGDIANDVVKGHYRVLNWNHDTDAHTGLITHSYFELGESPVSPRRILPLPAAEQGFIKLAGEVRDGNIKVKNIYRDPTLHVIRVTFENVDRLSFPPELAQSFLAANVSIRDVAKALADLDFVTAQKMLDLMPLSEPLVKDLGETTELITGYRDFKLVTTGAMFRLQSRNQSIWPAGKPLRALCKDNPLTTHDPPDEDCGCGIYAFNSPTHHDMQRDAHVWAEVYLWGDVLICESGYRAEFSYPKILFMVDVGTKTCKYIAEQLEHDYRVPCLLVKERDGKSMTEVIDDELKSLLSGGASGKTEGKGEKA